MSKSVSHNKFSFASGDETVIYALSGTHYPRNQPVAHSFERRRGNAAGVGLIKRCVDVMGAIAGIVLFGPLMLAIAALVAAEGGGAIFAHERIGRGGKPFRCMKFRTMVPDAKERLAALLESDPQARAEWEKDQKLSRDPRITRLGAFLRRTSLDELPQFFNVLKGDMSLVGPRPIVADEIARYGDKFPLYAKCRPGITGIWQVSGRNDTSYAHRVALDAHYAMNQTLPLDLSIMIRTFGAVVSGDGAR